MRRRALVADTENTSTETDETAAETQPGVAEAAEANDGAPKRKRSRRGSRGGRKRKKPAAAGDGEAATEAEGDVAEVAVHEGAPEYVPMSEWIDDFEARAR